MPLWENLLRAANHVLPFIETIGGGVLAGLAAAYIFDAAGRRRRSKRRKSALEWVSQTYIQWPKSKQGNFDKDRVFLTIKRSGRRLEITGQKLLVKDGIWSDRYDVTGEVLMSDDLPSFGRGVYFHPTNEEKLAWGFWTLQARKDPKRFLVHTEFISIDPDPKHAANERFVERREAWVWEPCSDPVELLRAWKRTHPDPAS